MQSGFNLLPRLGASKKRQTLTANFNHMRAQHDDKQDEVMQKLETDSKRFKGFRKAAPSTQKKQDRHLELYTDFILWRAGREAEDFSSADELEEFRFPSNNMEQLFENLRQFLLLVYQMANPISLRTGERIKYATLQQYRNSMMFWVRASFRKRKIQNPPSYGTIFYEMTEAMAATVHEYGDTNAKKRKKTVLGLPELRQLIDSEMLQNRCIENSEQHQAIWCIARHTSCRPGSIGTSGKYGRSKPLCWRNLEFSHGNESGQFTVVIEFDNIFIKRSNDPEKAQELGNTPLRVRCNSPRPGNLIFSVPHRLLTIALRRDLLENISSIDELMKSPGQNIAIKDEHLDDPLFYTSAPKGTGLNYDRPMSAIAMTDYLKTRGRRAGFVDDVTMYSIRRRAATDMAVRIGLAGTRRMMGHEPHTSTLEKYYLYLGDVYDATAVSLEEEVGSEGFSSAMRAAWAPLALGRLNDQQKQQTRGRALAAMTNKLVLADPDPPEDLDDPAVRKAYRQRQRAWAQQALIEEQAALAAKGLTREEFHARKAELNASKFANSVLERALELQASRAVPERDAEQEDVEQDDSLFVAEDSDDGEEDLDRIAETHDGEASDESLLDMEIDAELGEEVADQVASYEDQAKVFMEILLDNSLNVDVLWSDKTKTCPECVGDETVSAKQKIKEYNSPAHLDEHLEGKFHTAYEKWMRAAEIRRDQHPDQRYVCPYCEQTAAEDEEVSSWAHINKFKAHLQQSSAERDGDEHDRLMAEDGWYDADFRRSGPTRRTKEKKEQADVKNLKKSGVKYENVRELIGGTEPFDGFPGLVRGSYDQMPERFATTLGRSQVSAASDLTARQAGALVAGATGDAPTHDEMHKELRSTMYSTGYPRGPFDEVPDQATQETTAPTTMGPPQTPAQPPTAKSTGKKNTDVIMLSDDEGESSSIEDEDAMDEREG